MTFQKILQLEILKNFFFFFFVDFNPIDTNVLDIHRYLMKGKYYKIMFELIK